MGTIKNGPSFKNAPVVEVAVGLRFETLAKLHTAHVGALWASTWRDAYPLTEQQPILSPDVGLASSPRPAHAPQGERIWFLNEARTALIQVQQDRFIHNWQRVEDDPSTYPRYDTPQGGQHTVRATFRRELDRFTNFIENEKLGSVIPLECEVTYVNLIPPIGWQSHSELSKVLAPWSGVFSNSFLPTPENIALTTHHRMGGDAHNAEGDGQLKISLEPGFTTRPERKPTYRLTLTARRQSFGTTDALILQGLDSCHDWVVNGFESITTAEMHRIWMKE